MTLLDAKQYDPTAGRLRRNIIASVVVAALVLIWLGWMYCNWPEGHVIDQVFAALQKSDFEKAYGIWVHDPKWKQHPDKWTLNSKSVLVVSPMLADNSSQQIRTKSFFRSAAQSLSINSSHPPRLSMSSTGQSAAKARTALCQVPLRQRSVHRSQSAIA